MTSDEKLAQLGDIWINALLEEGERSSSVRAEIHEKVFSSDVGV